MIKNDFLNSAQTIFALFYAIMWGTLANVWPRWRAFDWAAKHDKKRAIYRSTLSLIVLNLIPILFFIFVSLRLGYWTFEKQSCSVIWWKLFVIMSQPFVLIGLYKIWVATVQLFRKTFYPIMLSKSDKCSGIRPEELDPKYAIGNYLTGVLYIILPLCMLYFTDCP